MKKIVLFYLILVSFIFAKVGPEYVEDEVIVKFKKGIPKTNILSTSSVFNLAEKKSYKNIENLYVFKIQDGKSVKEKIEELKKNPDIEYAEPNYIVRINLTPNDTNFSYQWGLHNTYYEDYDINAPSAWDTTTGSSSVVIAVIDSGVDYNHEDLTSNMWKNSGEDGKTAGVDDDGNGYVDDIYGINAITGTGNPMDDNGHGTHCAGIIGAIGNNNKGVCGVNWSVKIMALKFLNSSGSGSTSDAIECIDYVISMKNKGVNIVATSNSWGGYGESLSLNDAIDRLLNAGILFICAAGNDNVNNDYNYFRPAGTYLPNVITVSSIDSVGTMSSFANYGRFTVDVGAPGSSIYSTLRNNSYGYMSGTSMACPFVAGLAGLIKAKYSSYNWYQVKNLILTGGSQLSSLIDKTITGKLIKADGSLNPSGRVVTSRLRPIGSEVSCFVGDGLDISVLNIKDSSGNGEVNVNILETGGTITLYDNGTGFDEKVGDGIYSNTWYPSSIGKYTFRFPSHIHSYEDANVYVFNEYNYEKPSFNWIDITATGTNLNLSDDSWTEINLPFSINFGDSGDFDKVYVSSNGVITFFEEETDYIHTYIPVPLPDGIVNIQVAPFRDDLLPSGTNNVYYAIVGSSPNRKLIIEWRNVPHAEVGGENGVTFQVVFFEDRSDIVFNYKDVIFGNSYYDKGGNASIGIQISNKHANQFSLLDDSLSDNMTIVWKTNSHYPNKPVNLIPENDKTDVPVTPILRASDYLHPDNVGFAGSQWQIRSESGDYNSPVYDSGETNPSTSHKVPSGELESENIYYWRVRYKDSDGFWSSWSDETKFTTGTNHPPERPTNKSPVNNAENIPLQPTLIGSEFKDPDNDVFWMAEWRIKEEGKTTYWTTRNQATSLVIPSGVLDYEKTYYWSVRYSDPYENWSYWSAQTSFTTLPLPQEPPAKPENISPIDGKTDVSLTPTLKATGFSDRNRGDTQKDSYWQIATDNTKNPDGSFKNVYWEKPNAGVRNQITVDIQLQPNTKYYWHVKYQDSADNWSEWSDETYFITQTTTAGTGGGTGEGGGGCFIASACFGENSWQVKILREFRDRFLVKNEIGRRFVKFYYAHSPSIADYLRRHYLLTIPVKLILYLILFIYLIFNGVLSYVILTFTTIYIFKKILWKRR